MTMRVEVIAGFLGSGKTTLLSALARRYVAQELRVAIIENDVGRDGIDAPLLRGEGFVVTELVAGCICCWLVTHSCFL